MRTPYRALKSPLSLYAWGVASLLALGCPAPDGDPTPGEAAEDEETDDDDDTQPAADSESPSDAATSDTPDPTEEPEMETGDDSVGETTDGPEDDGDDDDGLDTTTFLVDAGGGPAPDCDLWVQDCPQGEKCMPWANDGGVTWNSAKCVPLAEELGEPGDACTVEGSGVSGVDSCTTSSMCWNVDGETNTGTCIGFCSGSAAAPVCDDPSTACTITNEGMLILCLPSCDPLLQDCAGEGEACYGTENGYVCAPDASGEPGAYGDPCEAINACDPGLECLGAGATPGCASGSCCTSFCDTSDPGASAACPGAGGGQECVSAYAEGAAPPGYEDVGYCAIGE